MQVEFFSFTIIPLLSLQAHLLLQIISLSSNSLGLILWISLNKTPVKVATVGQANYPTPPRLLNK